MTPTYPTIIYQMALANLQGMNVDLARKLLDVVGSEEQFFSMSEKDLRNLTHGRSKIYRDDYRRNCLQQAVTEDSHNWRHFLTSPH